MANSKYPSTHYSLYYAVIKSIKVMHTLRKG